MRLLVLTLSLLNLSGIIAFGRRKHNVIPKQSNSKALALGPAEFVPAVVITTAAVFALFNIENKIDLTDAGRAAARAKRKALKKPSDVDKSNLDPYRWFADDDDEIDLFPPKKSGGGCG